MWRRLFKIFGKRVVILKGHDGDIYIRFAKQLDKGRLVCHVICDNTILNTDGTATKSYIDSWEEI